MRIALLGASHPRTQDYLQALAGFPDLEIAGLYDADCSYGQKLAAEFAIPYNQNMADFGNEPLDAVIICASAEQNPNLIKQAAKHTRYMMCEVPLAPALSDAKQLVEFCKSQGVTLYPALALRTLPVIQSLKQMIDKNDLGQILGLKLEYQIRKPDSMSAGQPVLIEKVMQVTDLVCWLLDTDIVEVAAETGEGLLHSGNAVPDVAMLSVQLGNQTYATLDVSMALPATYPMPEKLEIELVGTGGWVHIDAYRQKIDTYADTVTWANWGSDPIAQLLRDFLNIVRQGEVPAMWGDDVLRAQAVALSVWETGHSTV